MIVYAMCNEEILLSFYLEMNIALPGRNIDYNADTIAIVRYFV